MSNDKEKDERPTTPLEDTQRTTPFSTAPASGETPPGLPDGSLHALRQRYDILGEVGRGGMGIVYKARDRETGAVVALKVLRPEIAADTAVIERFKSELLLARKITHKNVCRIYELLRFGDAAVISMEYIEGESLRRFLTRYSAVAIRKGVQWASQICNALSEAHGQGIVHRDLKPENIVIDRDGNVKVMDFGIARSLETLTTTTGVMAGTPAYMAPEQAQAKPTDTRSDIYSLGLVLYEMFTGQSAFRADSPVGFAMKQIHDTPPPPHTVEPYLPGFLDRTIQRCLEKDPNKRFQSASELESALTEKGTVEASAPQPELPPHLLNGRRSDFALILLGLAALAGLVALAPVIKPEAGVRVRMTREMVFEKAGEEVTRRGWTPGPGTLLTVTLDKTRYNFLAERFGYASARNAITREFPPLLYQVQFHKAGNPDTDKWDATIVFEPDGSVRSLELPVLGWIPKGTGLPHTEALQLAKQTIQQTFGEDASRLELESDAPLETEGRHGNTLHWVKREPTGIEWHFQADIYDRPTLLKKSFTLPEDYHPPRSSERSIYLMIGWSLLAAVLFLARRLWSQVRARDVLVFSALALLASTELMAGIPSATILMYFLVLPIFAVGMAIWLVILTPTITHLAQRPWPYLVDNYLALIHLRLAPRATGLALVRGISCGLLITGFSSLLLRLGLSAHLTWPELWSGYDLVINSFVATLTFLAILSTGAVALAYTFGFFLSLARRWTALPLLLAVVGGVIEVALSDFTLPPNWFRLSLPLVTGVAFAWVMLKFDLLTLLAAMYTSALWDQGYALTQIYQTVGNLQVWFAFVIWAAVFAWAAFVGFRPLWERLGWRLAEMFG
jgi:predicted Ser/Thr protein kinase